MKIEGMPKNFVNPVKGWKYSGLWMFSTPLEENQDVPKVPFLRSRDVGQMDETRSRLIEKLYDLSLDSYIKSITHDEEDNTLVVFVARSTETTEHQTNIDVELIERLVEAISA